MAACQKDIPQKSLANPILSTIDTLKEENTMHFKAIKEDLTPDFLMGKFDPAKDERFVLMQAPYSSANMYARKEVFEAFKQMQAHAKKDGISLTVVSCVRTFNTQKTIWESKWKGERPVNNVILGKDLKDKERALRILEWNAMPGTSRHHWGTDIDINSVDPAYFAKEKGKKEYAWLVENAPKYGFCQTYSEVGPNRPTGYKEEKWHWSYMPIAQHYTEQYPLIIKDSDIKGFLGAATAIEIEVVKNYVLGINPACKEIKLLDESAKVEQVIEKEQMPNSLSQKNEEKENTQNTSNKAKSVGDRIEAKNAKMQGLQKEKENTVPTENTNEKIEESATEAVKTTAIETENSDNPKSE